MKSADDRPIDVTGANYFFHCACIRESFSKRDAQDQDRGIEAEKEQPPERTT
jgi:hypothetical protein